jgi:hypothetical protein
MDLQELECGLLIRNYTIARDGGSYFLDCETTSGQKFKLAFIQHIALGRPNPKLLPGRIYLNEKLIDLNSVEEKSILKSITNFNIANKLKHYDYELDKKFESFFHSITGFYNSDTAMAIKQKVDQNLS